MDCCPNLGGSGGGAIFIFGGEIDVSGTIQANGGTGQWFENPASQGARTGGGGAGGSILLDAGTLNLGSGLVTANGGSTETLTGSPHFDGGAGGVGRIHLEYASLTGSTSPAADLLQATPTPTPTVTVTPTITATATITAT
ncbi:MAG TPA: hypothetical protein VKU60_16515, partial [Chloroflexota bacterium]|nr:hypothetical protein [Chloroflexota bacterium]